MNAKKFSDYFFMAPVFEIPGRTFPVEVNYLDILPEDYVDSAVKKAVEIHMRELPGDILIFMTGKEDIDATCILIKKMV